MNDRKKNLWIYNAGKSFSGNPKWMFMYMQKKHPEVKGIWLCYDKETRKYIRRLGYEAHLFRSLRGKKAMKEAGVYVVNQVKEVIQPELEGITMLNLWHGVGCKTVEQKVDFGFLQERIFKKYIQNNKFYRNNQLFLVTSPLMEKHFIEQCGLTEEQLVRAGYPCCEKMDWVTSYDHDVLAQKGLSSDARIAIYSPTYRDGNANDFFGKAIPDMNRLISKLKETNTLLIFKMHPQMENDIQYNNCKRMYGECPNLLFWDNVNDVYEIFDRVDLAIIDYSSIFYDMLSAGVKHFVRYMFDLEDKNNLRDFVFDVKEMTCGRMCDNFDALLEALDRDVAEENEERERTRIHELFWAYSSNTIEEIYRRAMEHVPNPNPQEKVLYSFDIFDTLIQRKGLSPVSIFTYVKQKMYQSDVHFPRYLMERYRYIRQWCESNVREYYRKTLELREDDRLEISFDEIFERLGDVYELNAEQIALLKQWELEAEYESVIPYEKHVAYLKELLKEGETVVLISDMYLPKEFLLKMLAKADPVLATLPLFLSSEYGVQKSTKKLYLKVFESFSPYDFTKWIHYGDNRHADFRMPQQLGIQPVLHEIDKWSPYEQKYLTANASYDAYCLAARMVRFKNAFLEEYGKDPSKEEQEIIDCATFSYCYVSTWLVPYVAWAIHDAQRLGIECLYFISRDGHPMKRIADEIIAAQNLNIKTKYIYGSRKAWRIPSYIDEIDEDFFAAHGNIADVRNFDMLLKAMNMDEESFDRIFPGMEAYKAKKTYTPAELTAIRETAKNTKAYHEYLLARAKEERGIVLEYLKQEIDFSERFAFVEYWGRGYTQDCMMRLIDHLVANDATLSAQVRKVYGGTQELPDNIFYYLRSIYFSKGRLIRRNFNNAPESLIMVEAVFANIPYKSITGYCYEGDTIVPIKEENPLCNMELYQAMERYLPQFARDTYTTTLLDEKEFDVSLCSFGLGYFKKNVKDRIFKTVLAKLYDSVSVYGTMREFAPRLTIKEVYRKVRDDEYILTKSFPLSLERSPKIYRRAVRIYDKFRGA